MDPLWLEAVVLLTTGSSTCTGTIVEPSGTVLTAYHCVASGLRPRVQTHDGRTFRGRTLAADPERDLALVEVAALGPDAPTLPLATDDPALGAPLWAIGHPFAPAAEGSLRGTLRWSVSRGITSAVGDLFLQTDAALNPGNSGGPLLDESGHVVGVVSRKLQADNVAFATRAPFAAALLRERTRPPLLGGSYGIGAVLAPMHDHRYAIGAELSVVAKERVWLRADVGGAIGGDPTPLLKLGLGVRQRVGTGPLSTAIDVGAATLLTDPADVELAGRFTLAGVGLGAMWAPTSGAYGVELAASLPFHGVW